MKETVFQNLDFPEQPLNINKQTINPLDQLKDLKGIVPPESACRARFVLDINNSQSCKNSDQSRLETDKTSEGCVKQQAKILSSNTTKSNSTVVKELAKTLERCRAISRKSGVHSVIKMEAAGFQYIDEGDTAYCNQCGLKISKWTLEMNPFSIHQQNSPNCQFVRSIISTLENNSLASSQSSTSNIIALPTTNCSEQEKSPKRQKIEIVNRTVSVPVFNEVESVKEVRHRTFSHWPHRTSPSQAQMIEAGFFNCNVGDRTICIYCNLVCQQWTPHVDDPCEVHKELSPNCPYVVNMLMRRAAVSLSIINQTAENNETSLSNASNASHSHEIVRAAAACNPYYTEIPKRYQSFSTWPKDPLPPVDDLVRAGFFYTGTATIVTCFFCNGSLQNWGQNDNPTIEHARWFPHCGYAKQLCGHNLYRKIQESKRATQGLFYKYFKRLETMIN